MKTLKTAEELFDKFKTLDGEYHLRKKSFIEALTEHDKEIRDKIEKLIEKDTVNGYSTEATIALTELLNFIEEK